MKWVIKIFATGLGLGFSPILGGTLGTLLAIPIFYYAARLPGFVYWPLTLGVTLFAIKVSDLALPFFTHSKKAEDPSQIVIDEVAGFLWAAGIVRYLGLWKPVEGIWWMILVSFLFFRIFDAAKWWPVGWAERHWHGGLGIVM